MASPRCLIAIEKPISIILIKNIRLIMKTEQKQERKCGRERGKVTQKVFSFRIDVEHLPWLELQANKGRYINDLIAKDRLTKS